MKGFSKFAGYISLKWVLFYAYQFTEGVKWNLDKVNGEGIFLAAFILLAFPLLELLILFFPLQLAIRQKRWITIPLLFLSFGFEFIVGWYVTNQHFEVWMAIKIVLSIALFGLIYRKQLMVS